MVANLEIFLENKSRSVLGYLLDACTPKFKQVVAAQGHEVVPSHPFALLHYLVDHAIVEGEGDLLHIQFWRSVKGDAAFVSSNQDVVVEHQQSVGAFFDLGTRLDVFVVAFEVEEVPLLHVKGSADKIAVVEDSYSFEPLKVGIDVLDVDLVGLALHLCFGGSGNLDDGVQVYVFLFSELGTPFSEGPVGILSVFLDVAEGFFVEVGEVLHLLRLGLLIRDGLDFLPLLLGRIQGSRKVQQKLYQLFFVLLYRVLEVVVGVLPLQVRPDQHAQFRFDRRRHHHFSLLDGAFGGRVGLGGRGVGLSFLVGA